MERETALQRRKYNYTLETMHLRERERERKSFNYKAGNCIIGYLLSQWYVYLPGLSGGVVMTTT